MLPCNRKLGVTCDVNIYKIPSWRPAILTKAYLGFLESFQVNTYLKIGHEYFLPHPYYSSVTSYRDLLK
jgi:hypothetical protein